MKKKASTSDKMAFVWESNPNGTYEEIMARIIIAGEQLKNEYSTEIIEKLVKGRDETSKEVENLRKMVNALKACLAENETLKKKATDIEKAFAQSRKGNRAFLDSLRAILLQEKTPNKAKMEKIMDALGMDFLTGLPESPHKSK